MVVQKLLLDFKKMHKHWMIVVVGYGTQKKKFLIGSVSQVGSKELMMAPQANLSNMMTGKLPGVTSVQRSGLPGNDQTSINIRGLGTFLDSSPLILVDGVERMLNLSLIHI